MAPPPKDIALGDRRLTRVGLGTNRLTDTSANRSFLQAAVDAGIEMIDTAHLYTGGASEATIGATLPPLGERLVVATKGGYEPGGGVERLRAELEQSFERLGVERITLYYLHRDHPDLPLEDAMRLLAEYRAAGRIEHVGLSEVGVEQIERARAVLPIAAVQNEYSLGERKHEEVVDFCAAEGLVFVPFYPLAGGNPEVLGEVADRLGATAHQVKLAWLLKRSPAMLPIPGTLSAEHLRENLGALELELTDEDWARLSDA